MGSFDTLKEDKDSILPSEAAGATVASIDTIYTEIIPSDFSNYQASICADSEELIAESECPPCIPDPNAIVPNWKSLPVRTPIYKTPEDTVKLGVVSSPFLNQRKCEYSIVVLSDYEGAGCDAVELEDRLNQTLETAVRGLLRYYGKSETDGEGGTIESLQGAATVSGHYISPRYKIKMKVLVSVPFEALADIEDLNLLGDEPLLSDLEGDENLEDIPADPIIVSYNPDDLLQNMYMVTQAFRIFNFNQAVFERRDGAYFTFSSGKYFDYGTQRELLQDTLSSLNDFLESKGYTKISPVMIKTTRFVFNREDKVTGKIEFEFDSEYVLKKINLTERGCGSDSKESFDVEYLGLSFSEPWTDKTTMSYLVNLEDMAYDLEASDPMTWQDFTTKYTYPSVSIKYSNTIETTDEDTGEIIEIDLGSSIFGGLLSLSDIVADSWNTYLCMTPQQLAEFNTEVIADEQTILNLAAEQMLKVNEISESIWDKWPEIKKDVKDGGIQTLWTSVLNKTGLCNFLSLRRRAIECLMAGLTYSEGLQVIIEAAIDGLSVKDYGRLFELLSADQQLNLQDEVKAILGVDTFSAPWDSEVEEVEEGATYIDHGEQNFVLGGESADSVETMAALKETLISQTQTVEDLETLLDLLGNIPGVELLSEFSQDPDCAVPPTPGLPVSSLVTTGIPGICKSNAPLTFNISKYNVFKGIFGRVGMDRFAAMADVIKRKIKDLLVQLMVSVIDEAVNAIYEAICEEVQEASDLDAQTLEGSGVESGFDLEANTNPSYGDPTYLSDIINDSFLQSEGTEQQLSETVSDLFSITGGTSDVNAETLNEFVTDLSICLKAKEMGELLLGIDNSFATGVVLDLVESHYPDLKPMFSGPTTTNNFFKHMGSTFPLQTKEALNSSLENLNIDPIYSSSSTGCSTKSQIQDYRDYRLQALTQKDCTPYEHASELYCQQVHDLKDQIKDLLQGIPDPSPPPGCEGDENAVVQRDPEVLGEAVTELISSLLETVGSSFDSDLIGREGFLNMVLSDTYSLPWRRHKRKYNRQRFYVNYKDQWADQYGPDDEGNDRTKWWQFLGGLLGKLVHGYYPVTVAEYLREQLEGISALNLTLYENIPTTESVSVPVFSSDELGIPILSSLMEEKKSDIRFTYVDNNNGTIGKAGELAFNYAFNIEQSNYIPGSETLDIARTKIIDIDAEYDDNSNTEIKVETTTSDLYVTGSLPTRVYDSLSTYNIVLTDKIKSPQASVFYGSMANIITDSGYKSVSTDDMVSVLGELYHQNLYNEKLSQLAVDVRVDSAGVNVNPAFVFGFNTEDTISNQDMRYYDPFVQVNGEWINIRNYEGLDLHYYDPENPPADLPKGLELNFYGTYLSTFPEFSIYGELQKIFYARKAMEEANILGISQNERVFFLNPDEHGGRYARPRIYVEPREDTGWLGLAQALVPEEDGCDPKKSDIINFSDIKQKVEEIYFTTPTDPRVEADPDCILEKPYFKVLERLSVAGLEGAVMAVTRIYVVETMLQGMPVFGKYEAIRNKVMDDTIVDYVISVMENDLKVEGQKIRNPLSLLRGENYWYAFLEQCVQVYRRRYLAGEVELTPDAQMAISNIDSLLPGYETPTRQTFGRDKDNGVTERKAFRRYKQDMINQFIQLTEQDAKTLMKLLVYEQFEAMSENLKSSLEGLEMAPYIDDIDRHVFGNDILEIGDIPSGTFALQRYLYLDPKSGINFPVPLPFLSDQTKGVVSFTEWENWLVDVNNADPEFCEKSLSAYFGTLTALTDAETGEVVGSEGTIGVRYGIRQVWSTQDPTFMASLSKDGSNFAAQELRAFDVSSEVFVAPMINSEIDAIDSPLNSIDVEGSYNQDCLLDDLFNQTDWMLIWKYSLSLPKILSLLTIYVVKGFLPSIGQKLGENEGGDGPFDLFKGLFDDTAATLDPPVTIDPVTGMPIFPSSESGIIGGEWDSEASSSRGLTYYDWDQDMLRKSKRAVRRMFMAFWNYRDAPSFDLDLEFKLDIKKDLRKLMDFGLSGVKIKWPLRRRLTDRPFDKDGEECD